jgi:hypothetical protein
MFAAAFAQRVDLKLPYGCTPTPEIDRKCDQWLKKFFAGKNDIQKMVKNCPLELSPWIAARFTVVTGVAFGNMETNPNPPTEKALWLTLRNLTIPEWNARLKLLWRGFYQKPNGGPGYRGDPTVDHLQSKGIFFSGN